MVPTIKLNNDITIPQLGFGTWKLKPLGQAKQAVTWAIEAGYRHIDTARIYLNEKDVGKAINENGVARKDIFLVTKLWNGDQSNVQDAFEKSLKRLGVDYVDLYLMHFPVTSTRLSAWKTMEQIYKSSKARSIGVSNFTITHLKELMANSEIVPVVNQVEFHPFLFQKELLEFCKSNGIVLEAYSPLAHGQKVDHPILSNIAAKHKKTNAQVMIRWSIQHGNVVIPKSKTKERIQENFQVFDFALSADEMNQINDLNENLRTCWDPTNTP